jgi:hypothetical protein
MIMNEKFDKIKEEISALKKQEGKLLDDMKKVFCEELCKIFEDNPLLEEISMYRNNHEFNDGDPTSFYLGYDDMTITIDGNEIEHEYGDEKHPLTEKLVCLFANTQDIHEMLFSDDCGRLSINERSAKRLKGE